METQQTRVSPTIRRASMDDAEAVAKIFEGPRVIWGTLQLPYPSTDAWRKRLQEGPGTGVVSLLACIAKEPVGILGLHTHPDQPRIRHVASMGMAVRDDWQRRGIGKALVRAAVEMADQWMALARVELTVFADNEPAIRLYESFGFEVEGTLRLAALRDGKRMDVLTMARLAPGAR